MPANETQDATFGLLQTFSVSLADAAKTASGPAASSSEDALSGSDASGSVDAKGGKKAKGDETKLPGAADGSDVLLAAMTLPVIAPQQVVMPQTMVSAPPQGLTAASGMEAGAGRGPLSAAVQAMPMGLGAVGSITNAGGQEQTAAADDVAKAATAADDNKIAPRVQAAEKASGAEYLALRSGAAGVGAALPVSFETSTPADSLSRIAASKSPQSPVAAKLNTASQLSADNPADDVVAQTAAQKPATNDTVSPAVVAGASAPVLPAVAITPATSAPVDAKPFTPATVAAADAAKASVQPALQPQTAAVQETDTSVVVAAPASADNTNAVVAPVRGDLKTTGPTRGVNAAQGISSKASIAATAAAKGKAKTSAKDDAGMKQHDKTLASAGDASTQSDATDDVSTPVASMEHGQRDDAAAPVASASVSSAAGHAMAAATVNIIAPQTLTPNAAGTHAAKTADVATPVTEPAQPSLPAINTAKLVQSIGQSEMRVGMKSAEFGSISIRTSSTADAVSAQISVDHSDLAKALATHIPEMQARLTGSGHTGHVQIDLSGQNTNPQGGSRESNGSNGASASSGDGRGTRQQGDEGSSQARGYAPGQRFVPAAVAATAHEGRAAARLDVRV